MNMPDDGSRGIGKAGAIGIIAGVALFVAIALLSTISATGSSGKARTPAPVAEPVIAPAEQVGAAFAAVAAHIKPAVVSVYSERMVKVQPPGFLFPFGDDFFDQYFGQSPQPRSNKPREYRIPQSGMGSGMIVDGKGHILTNYHVVGEVDNIKIQLADGRSFDAEIVGTDRKTDVAIIKIAGRVPADLPVVHLGDSDALEVGNLVMAVGAPFGLTQTVTLGIISATGRSDVGIAAYEDFLQSDAAINPGNSGGPLVNMRGEAIGMNSAIATGGRQFGGGGQSAGVGFAIPSNMIKAMLPTLVKGKPITRGMLGVVIQDLTRELAGHFGLEDAKGALVSQVGKGAPAEKAGLKVGDVIVGVNGKEVRDTRQLRNFIASTAPGTTVSIEAIRDGKPRTFNVTIGKLEAEVAATPKTPREAANQLAELGLEVQTLTPELANRLNLQGERGVLITSVDDGSPASVVGLDAGDLIVEANRVPVANVGELQTAVAKSPDHVLLLVKRGGTSLFVVIRLK